MIQILSIFVFLRLLRWSLLKYVEWLISNFRFAISPFLLSLCRLMMKLNWILLKLRLRLFVMGYRCIVLIDRAHGQCIPRLCFHKKWGLMVASTIFFWFFERFISYWQTDQLFWMRVHTVNWVIGIWLILGQWDLAATLQDGLFLPEVVDLSDSMDDCFIFVLKLLDLSLYLLELLNKSSLRSASDRILLFDVSEMCP